MRSLTALSPMPLLKFGQTAPFSSAGVTSRLVFGMTEYTNVLERDEFKKYDGKTVPLKDKYDRLPTSMKGNVNWLKNDFRLDPLLLESYKQTGKTGLLEELSDFYFEYLVLSGMSRGYLSLKTIRQAADVLEKARKINAEGGDKSFNEVRSDIRQFIDKDKVERFRVHAGLKQKKRATRLLVAMHLNLAQEMLREGKDFTSTSLSVRVNQKFRGEADELLELLEASRIKRFAARLYLKNVVPVAGMLGRRQVMAIPKQKVSRQLGLAEEIPNPIMARYLIAKHTGRQELEYTSSMTYNQRKGTLKPFEEMVEAFLLNLMYMTQSEDVAKRQ